MGFFLRSQDLTLLKNINTIYTTTATNNLSNPQEVGIEFSSGKGSYTNTNKMAKYYTGSSYDNPMYAGSWLFNFLYSSGIMQEYGGNPSSSLRLTCYDWRTGRTATAGSDYAQRCTMFFGIIPIFWSNGKICADSSIVYGNNRNASVIDINDVNCNGGFSEVTTSVDVFGIPALSNMNNEKMFDNWVESVKEHVNCDIKISSDIFAHAYKSLNNTKYNNTSNYSWFSNLHYDGDGNGMRYKSILLDNAMGVGIDFTNCNSYKSCDFKNGEFTLVRSRKNESQTWQQYETIYKWMPDKLSTVLRLGIIPIKEFSPEDTEYEAGNISEKSNQLIYGYYKFGNFAISYPEYNIGNQTYSVGQSDTEFFKSVYQNGYGCIIDYNSLERWSIICQANNTFMNDYYFGSMPIIYSQDPTQPTTLCPASGTFNVVLKTLANDLNPASSAIVNNNSNGPLIVDQYTTASELALNMFEYSTIPYVTGFEFIKDLEGYEYIAKVADIIPVFGTPLKESIYDGYCCVIHTFQSIIYNTYCNDQHATYMAGSNDHLKYNYTGVSMPAIPTSQSANFKNQNQTKVVATKYDNFVMRYIDNTDPTKRKLYCSFAIKINGSKGKPTGATAGPCYADVNKDWLVWANGNIYVVDESIFNTYVYYRSHDFDMLDRIDKKIIGDHIRFD